MLTTTALLMTGTLIAQFQYGNALPSSEDHLKAPPGEKRVALIMDVSGSMSWGDAPHPDCAYARSIFGSYTLNKNEQMIASAIGCQTDSDGFLDLWENQIDFSITGFGYGSAPEVRYIQEFTRDKATLETAIRSLPASGGTPLEWGFLEGASHHNLFWTDARPNTNSCDQHYNIVLTDGVPNGSGTPVYNWIPCGGPPSTPGSTTTNVAPAAAWMYDDPNDPNDQFGAEELDAVCNLTGNQDIKTYTIGFGPDGDLDVNFLTNLAVAGGGFFVHAYNAHQLAAQFNLILNSIIQRTARFNTPSIQTNGLVLGNQAYSASFLPISTGPWIGNVKSNCVYPPKDPATGQYYLESNPLGADCLFRFRDPDGTGPQQPFVVVSDHPKDFFSGSTSAEARDGGAAAVLFRNGAPRSGPFAGGAPKGAVSYAADQFLRRRILTWTDPSSGYQDIVNLTDAQLFAWGCARLRLLSYLHGYDPSTVDCANNRPTYFGDFPLGAAVATTPTIIRWAQDCNVRNNCLVAANMDDGGVHFFDAADGYEHAVIIPKQLFQPGYVGNYPISTILDQPTTELTRRPFNNGNMVRVHDDRNGNGVIDGGESAYLVWGIGNGGAGYYVMDVSRRFELTTGVAGQNLLPDSDNPIYPIVATPGTWTEDLRNTLAKPYVGRARFGGAPEVVMAFGSGDAWYMDRPDEPFHTRAAGIKPPFDASAAQDITCAQFAVYNGYDPALADSQLCAAAGTASYQLAFGGAAGDFRSARPMWYTDGNDTNRTPAGAIGQFTFSIFDLDTGDYLVFEDLAGHEISPRYTGYLGTNVTLPIWLTSRPFVVRLHIDDTQTRVAAGVVWTGLKWIPDRLLGGCGGGDPCEICDRAGGTENGACTNATGECAVGSPQYVLNQCRFCDKEGNGTCTGVECGVPTSQTGVSCTFDHSPFVAIVGVGLLDDNGVFMDTTQNDAVRVLFTKQCRGTTYPNGRCYDETSITELSNMICPISAEVRAYEEGGVVRSLYVGDQCGQMWKFWTADSGANWNAKRLFNVNDLSVANSESRDYRKFERPVDLVVSQCTGTRSIGVYFGTGDLQRPGSIDNLEGPTGSAVTAYTEQALRGQVTSRNIGGVFFDHDQWDTGASRTLADFENLTPVNFTTASIPLFSKTGDGWFFALRDNEQVLRDPLVFDGVFYLKTNTTQQAVTTCEPGVTLDRVYAVNNCTSQAALDPNGNGGAPEARDREAATGEQNVGSNLLLYTPPDGSQPLIAMGGNDGDAANLARPNPNRRALRMYMWWRIQ